jgi:hypothetical protein
MRLEFHPQISADISEITRYYEEVAGPQLANEFYSEYAMPSKSRCVPALV